MKTILPLLILFCVLGKINNSLANNYILIKGTSSAEELNEMTERVRFYATYFQITETCFVVEFTEDLPKSLHGVIFYEKNIRFQNFLIKIQQKLPKERKHKTLAHEMLHAAQFIRKELHCDEKGHYHWKGQYYGNIKRIAYHDRPWEKEALREEDKLHELFRKKHQAF